MAFSRSVFTVLLLCVVCKASNVPVFLWGGMVEPVVKANPLITTTSPAFSIILSEEIREKTMTVVFVDRTLSVEDFSHRNAAGETSFPYLHKNYRNAVYLPSVENPMMALNLLEDPKKVRLTEAGLIQDNAPTGKSMIIYMEDAKEGESRPEMLRRHNDFMEDTVTSLQMEHKSVLAVYTALDGSWSIPHSRVRRQASNSNVSTDYLLDGARLYVKNIRLVDGASTVVLEDLRSTTSEINSTALTMKARMNFPENSIVLNFKGDGGYWFFESVTLNPGTENTNDLYPTEEVFALVGFSYRCAQNITFGDANSTRHILFEDLKVQPVFESTNQSVPVQFGDSFNCVGFFSAPIWSGLFVVAILLSITFFGIMMMMDIRTMDRFDDPKGKTITINAGE